MTGWFLNRFTSRGSICRAGSIWLLACAGCWLSGCEESRSPSKPAERSSLQPASPVGVSGTQPAAIHRIDGGPKQPARPVRDRDWFADVTKRSGIDFTYQNGREAGEYTLLETVGGGVALFDFDRDGDLDVFLTGGGGFSRNPLQVRGRRHALFRNEGNWRFEDVTERSGLSSVGDYTMGCAVGDYNRDGYPDLYVTCYGRDELWRNENGRTFSSVAADAGLDVAGWSTGAAWADYDGDGLLDLYVAGYAGWSPETRLDWCGDKAQQIRDCCGPSRYPGAADRLFRNSGRGTFEEATDAAGIRHDRHGLGVLAADLNDDGWIDFYVANDTDPNDLYWGGPMLPFVEGAAAAGVALGEFGETEGSMGIDAGDFNRDGRPDLWMTNFENEENSLYRNDGNGQFTHLTLGVGLGGVNRRNVGFGTHFADFDGDGWEDLLVLNGNVFYHIGQAPYRQHGFLFRNVRGERFADATSEAAPYFSLPHAARGAAVGDLDNDGAADLVVVHHNSPVTVLRNRNTPQHWIGIELRGTDANIDGVGARVTVSSEQQRLVKWRCSGRGYLSHADHRLLFPLSGREPVAVEVVWPGGRRESFPERMPGAVHRLVEGEGLGLSPPVEKPE